MGDEVVRYSVCHTYTVRGSSLPASSLYLRVDRGIGENGMVAGIASVPPKTGMGSWDVDWTLAFSYF